MDTTDIHPALLALGIIVIAGLVILLLTSAVYTAWLVAGLLVTEFWVRVFVTVGILSLLANNSHDNN